MAKQDAGNAERAAEQMLNKFAQMHNAIIVPCDDHQATVLAIDPGCEQSAIVQYDGIAPCGAETLSNEQLRIFLTNFKREFRHDRFTLACETIECYGQRVGNETFQTMRWIGRFEEIWTPHPFVLIPRRHVKMHFTGRCNGITDANISSCLHDRFGGSRQAAVGNKKQPGPLFGLGAHERSALAIAITFCEYEEYAKNESIR